MNIQDSDVLIVGAGMAGLTAAAFLSKAGVKVMVCEKGEKTGGLVSSFDYKGFVFDGGIRAIENSGIVLPMLRQLGIEVEFLPSKVSLGIGSDVIDVDSKDCLPAYADLLVKHFPQSKQEIDRIVHEIGEVMKYMDVQYGIDNPLFMDLKNNMDYVRGEILPWALKYIRTIPKINKLYPPVYEYLSRFSDNRSLLDMIGQHFFSDTPAFFALSYFSLYLDYKYPRGGTGTLPQALEAFVLQRGGVIQLNTEVVRVDSGKHEAYDAVGNIYKYRRLVWAADQKKLYRIIDLRNLGDKSIVKNIVKRQKLLSDKVGGDSVFSLYLTTDLEPSYFQGISNPHFFYTPATTGLSMVKLDEIKLNISNSAAAFVDDKTKILAWLERFLELTTYEISIPVLRDSSLAPQGKTGLIISSLFDYSLTKHIQLQGWYDAFKQIMTEKIIDVLDASIYPGLKKATFDSFTSSPLTLEQFSGNADGAITGWAFTNSTMPAVNKLPLVARSVLTPIPDTYQAGQWTFSPSGLPIAILTGKLASDRVLKDLG